MLYGFAKVRLKSLKPIGGSGERDSVRPDKNNQSVYLSFEIMRRPINCISAITARSLAYTEESKINKSKALAQKALKRL